MRQLLYIQRNIYIYVYFIYIMYILCIYAHLISMEAESDEEEDINMGPAPDDDLGGGGSPEDHDGENDEGPEAEPRNYAEFSKYRAAFKNNMHLASHLYQDRTTAVGSSWF
jgi:hypothetical protein